MMAMTRAVKIALCGSEDSESIAARQDRGLPLYNFLTDVQDILNPPEYHWCYRDLSCDASTWGDHFELCNGMKQSPIDIVTADAKTPTTDPGALTTTMFDTDITGALANTGRVLRWFAVWGTAKPTISGGPLTSGKT